MKRDIQISDVSFETCILKHCEDSETGTILIATNNNTSCQISIDEGEVVAVSMGKFKGYEVTNQLLKDGIRRASFTRNMSFPHTEDAFISDSQIFLNRINGSPSLKLIS